MFPTIVLQLASFLNSPKVFSTASTSCSHPGIDFSQFAAGHRWLQAEFTGAVVSLCLTPGQNRVPRPLCSVEPSCTFSREEFVFMFCCIHFQQELAFTFFFQQEIPEGWVHVPSWREGDASFHLKWNPSDLISFNFPAAAGVKNISTLVFRSCQLMNFHPQDPFSGPDKLLHTRLHHS